MPQVCCIFLRTFTFMLSSAYFPLSAPILHRVDSVFFFYCCCSCGVLVSPWCVPVFFLWVLLLGCDGCFPGVTWGFAGILGVVFWWFVFCGLVFPSVLHMPFYGLLWGF